MVDETDPVVPISALEHFEYCPRQCALIHVDGVWADNRHTIAGQRAHRRVDSGASRRERGNQVLRSIPLWSETLGLSGRADVVEVTADGAVVPVEHKAGTPHGRAADVQICAQGFCLEEMLRVPVSHGFIWYGHLRRRIRVEFDDELRRRTLDRITQVRQQIQSGRLPAAPADSRCDQCQLVHHCLPSVTAGVGSTVQRSIDEVWSCGT
ncbi:MAG: CRISPR-associated protein Cas4 [Ilumatobacteraceae bacterium]